MQKNHHNKALIESTTLLSNPSGWIFQTPRTRPSRASADATVRCVRFGFTNSFLLHTRSTRRPAKRPQGPALVKLSDLATEFTDLTAWSGARRLVAGPHRWSCNLGAAETGRTTSEGEEREMTLTELIPLCVATAMLITQPTLPSDQFSLLKSKFNT